MLTMFSFKTLLVIVGAGMLLATSVNSLIASLPRAEKIVVVPPVKPFPTRNAFAESLPTLAVAARATMLGKLMTKSGQPCADVKRSFYVGSRDGLAYWNIRCAGSGDWMVQVRNDASVTRVACDEHPQIKARCWKPL